MLHRTIFILLISSCAVCAQDRGLFLVTRPVQGFPSKAPLVISWRELLAHKIISGNPENGDFDIADGNFGKTLTKRIVSVDNDPEPEAVLIDYVFESIERVYSFSVKANGKPVTMSDQWSNGIADLTTTYLVNYDQFKKNGKEVKSWPDKIIESTMSLYPDPATLAIYAPGAYRYDFAMFLNATFERWQETKNPAYLSYIKKWGDRFIDSHGYIDAKFYKVGDYNLDDLLAGRVFISLYEATKDPKYKAAAQQLRQQLQYQPRTSEGIYWQRQAYPYQVWLDGVYTADVFMMQYAKAFDEPTLFKEAMQQINLVHDHNGDADTGLLYHGWDESGNPSWANEDTGTSPEFWSRGIAWYYLALLECIDYVPVENIERKQLGSLFREVTKPVQKFQDQKTGLWYQVINKSYEPRNWLEPSASAMFAYAFAKGHNNGIFDKSYLASAQKTFESLKRDYIFFDDNDRLHLDGSTIAAHLNPQFSKADLDFYVSRERRPDDYRGLAALLYLAMELD